MTDPQTNKECTRASHSPGLSRTSDANTRQGKGHNWYEPDRVFIEVEMPHLVISSALKRGDTAAIWQEYGKAVDQPMYLDWLASLAGSYSIQSQHPRDKTRQSNWEHVLAAVPFLAPAEKWPVAAPDPAERMTAAPLLRQLQAWLRYQQDVTVVATSITYAEVCRWSPVTQREMLQTLARQQPNSDAPRLPAQHRFAEGFPELELAVFSVKRWLVRPELPEPGLGGQDEWAFRSQLAAQLAYMVHRPVQAQDVLPPAGFAEAVLEGLRMWIAELARRKLVCGWQVHPGQDDLMLLELSCADSVSPSVLIPIRVHQVRPAGLDLLLVELQQEFGNPMATGSLNA